MRLEKQNRRSCIGLMVALALLAGLIVWASLGGVPEETLADDVQGGGLGATVAPVEPGVPPGAGKPAPASRRP
jgi:hypothetical protein